MPAWWEIIVEALRNLGRSAHLNEIYQEAKRLADEYGRTIPENYQATIRRNIEYKSSDSESYQGSGDIFFLLVIKRTEDGDCEVTIQ